MSKNRMSIMLIGSVSSETMEEWTQKLTKEAGIKVDWHYYGGRAHVFVETKKTTEHDEVIALIHRMGVPVYQDKVESRGMPHYTWLTPEGRVLDQLGAYLPGDDICASPSEQFLNFLDRQKAARRAEENDPFSSSGAG